MASLPNIRGRRAVAPALAGEAAERTRPDVQRLEAHGLVWLNIEGPTEAETAWLAERHGFHPLAIEDVLSRRRQRSKIDEYDGYIFIVLHFPRFDKRSGRLGAAELNLFVADDLLITIQKEPLKPIGALWSRCETREDARERYLSKGSGYLLYEIVDTSFDYCFPILDKIGHKLDALEDAIFEGRSDEVVRDISNVKQEIINYRKIIKPQRPTLHILERSNQRYTPQDLEIYFDDIVDKNERIWDSLENYKEVVEALEATNESVIAHRQ
ncbi:MAG: magnesium transporter, partial [Miltoncostaeaceae bacterium]|nr:magnesium transporter [Miltoncostaeaceae bacterium]